MKLFRLFLYSSLVALALSSGITRADTASPQSIVKDTIDKIVGIVEELPGDGNTSTRRQKLREVINPHFDFKEMAKLSLGANWNTISSDQQSEFVSVFSDLLARTYLKRIENAKRDMIHIKGEKTSPPRAVVMTFINDKGDQFPIDYKFMSQAGNWKVYDVVIENIGLVTNYRNEFAGIIRKEKFDGLMKKLKTKSAEG